MSQSSFHLPPSKIDRWWTAPAWLIVALCCCLPLAWMLLAILLHPHMLRELRPTAFRMELLGRTLLYNGAAAIIATLLALPAAVVIGRGRGWLSRLIAFILPVTLLVPSIAYAYGWKMCLLLLYKRTGWDFFLPIPASAADVVRCIWSLATWLWALPAGIIGLSLRRLDANLQQQALLDGALWRVTAMQLIGPAIASVAIVAVLASQEFAVYEPTGISVVATEVRMVFETGSISSATNLITAPMGGDMAPQDQPQRAAAALATAIPLLAVIALLAFIAALGGRKYSAAESVDVGRWPANLDAGPFAISLTLLAIAITIIVPTASMVLAIQRPDAFNIPRIWVTFSPQAIGSIEIAAAAGAIALALALSLAGKFSPAMLLAALAAFLAGGQLLAIAMIRLYNHPGLQKWIYNAPPIIVMAYLARFGWIALVAGRSTHTPAWRELRELAAVDGATIAQTSLHVIWPIAWPLCAAAGVLVMALSLTEVPATVLLSPQRPPMIIPELMQWVHMMRHDDMLEGSLLLMAIVMVLGLAAVTLVQVARRLYSLRPRERTS
ncbi:MAG TPA: hypothetical protein VIL86_04925 [Tepidisphaeraceae bacterium]|jgi:ABC-type Fe3+ transport system permease subunit